MSLDSHPSAEDQLADRPHAPVTGRADAERPARDPGAEPIRTLLWTAATVRPLEEVAALVSLLKRTGEVPSPGDEALRAAAVSRPVAEVRQLVALLAEAPHEVDEADTTLRAAAVGRPIEDVAQLVTILGSDESDGPPTSRSETRSQAHSGVRSGVRSEALSNARSDQDGAAGAVRHGGSKPAGGRAPEPGVPARHLAEGPRITAGLAALACAETANRDASPAVRSALRRPAAIMLLSCGMIHLPTDFTALRSGGLSDMLALAFTGLCLILGVWLAVQDTVRIWAASGATAVGIITAHSLSGAGGLHLPASGVGDSFAWAKVSAVACAVLTSVLAGAVLMRREKAAEVANDG
ncbi:hypothetical protein ACIOJD_15355 [Streptomyces sp. NPDC088116]|uniref:hypothetical protein n=1 Tax=Streptomyces sp. NPDC088116 TaxID=3365825 RepID=UPI00382051FC